MLGPYLSELSGPSAGEYPYFDLYWTEPGRQAWVIGDAAPMGFALTRKLETEGACGAPVRQMAEFYIRPEARRTGLGLRAAAQIFAQGPGLWQVGILADNAAAQRFWPRAIAESGGEVLDTTHGDEGVTRLHFRMSS